MAAFSLGSGDGLLTVQLAHASEQLENQKQTIDEQALTIAKLQANSSEKSGAESAKP